MELGPDEADGLFGPQQRPEHPDAAVAREEIARYYDDRVVEARAQLERAQEEYRLRVAEQEAWVERGDITGDGYMVASPSMGRWQRAAHEVIYGSKGDRAEVERLGERDKALRRWLTAAGHDLGALAEPPPDETKRRSRRG